MPSLIGDVEPPIMPILLVVVGPLLMPILVGVVVGRVATSIIVVEVHRFQSIVDIRNTRGPLLRIRTGRGRHLAFSQNCYGLKSIRVQSVAIEVAPECAQENIGINLTHRVTSMHDKQQSNSSNSSSSSSSKSSKRDSSSRKRRSRGGGKKGARVGWEVGRKSQDEEAERYT